MKMAPPNRTRQPVQQIPIEAIEPGQDPLLEVEGLSSQQREYLKALSETGMVDLALKLARQRLKTAEINRMTVRKWRADSPLFAEVEGEAKGWYWDARGAKVQDAITKGRKFTGGEANLVMQQFNRAKPEEYLPPLVVQQHQTVSYQVEDGFTPTETEATEEKSKTVN